MDKNKVAKTPPMGWNSWDCYGAAVTEEHLKGNADYMAGKLKEFGWEYIVCDIQWYEPKAKSTEYNHFYPLEMDGYSRLIPAVNRFPSAKGGAGFGPIADYIHKLGLKFGIHIMRGIPRQAVHAATPILGSTATARDIAQSYSICSWNTDMYGVNPDAEGAQAYYNSLFELYAEWGVDFVKVDDICNTEYKPSNPYSAKREIELIRKAIDNCGRDMVLSLSPGPAVLSEAEHLSENANMWRMTGDFWDNWKQLEDMFERCNAWSSYVKDGCWPDCDMLPLGRLAVNTPGHDQNARFTNFTKDEQITMMTLWCIFRSPLMVGAELRENDDQTLSLLTNAELLRLLKHSYGARQVLRTHDTVIWTSNDEDGSKYVAFFNTAFTPTRPEISFSALGITGTYKARDLWTHEELGEFTGRMGADVNIHGARIYKLTKIHVNQGNIKINNPVLPGLYADPGITVFGDKFYIYPTTDGFEGWSGTYFKVFSSPDLVNWTDHGVILDLPTQISWGTTNAWAPYAVTRNGKYYFYFCANKNIGVAVSDSATGPFMDPLGKPLVAAEEIRDIGGGQAIDPMVFIDDDGEAYLYFGNTSLFVAKLNEDMISLKTPLKNITPPCFREAADVLKRDGIYHFTWSDDDTRSENYHINYGTSTSPMGPIQGCDLILEKDLGLGIKGTGHHSIVKVPNRDEYYIAYHRFGIPDGNGMNREVCIDKLEFNADGTIKKVKPTLEGITNPVEL